VTARAQGGTATAAATYIFPLQCLPALPLIPQLLDLLELILLVLPAPYTATPAEIGEHTACVAFENRHMINEG
jgi:hypothetical protein